MDFRDGSRLADFPPSSWGSGGVYYLKEIEKQSTADFTIMQPELPQMEFGLFL